MNFKNLILFQISLTIAVIYKVTFPLTSILQDRCEFHLYVVCPPTLIKHLPGLLRGKMHYYGTLDYAFVLVLKVRIKQKMVLISLCSYLSTDYFNLI